MFTKIMITIMTVASMIGGPSGSYVYKSTDDYYENAVVKIMKYSPNEYIIHEEIGEEDVAEMANYDMGTFGQMDVYLDADANGALSMIIYDLWRTVR